MKMGLPNEEVMLELRRISQASARTPRIPNFIISYKIFDTNSLLYDVDNEIISECVGFLNNFKLNYIFLNAKR